jgi:predicted enzyme related to lactoylglutathione lyase
MHNACLEHVNITVADPVATAALLGELFDWQIRWQGEAIDQGYSVHVGEPAGDESSYLALYRGQESHPSRESSYATVNGLNHLGIVVDDLDDVERRVLEKGFSIHSRADYEPGRRFYFIATDDLEIEVVSYR